MWAVGQKSFESLWELDWRKLSAAGHPERTARGQDCPCTGGGRPRGACCFFISVVTFIRKDAEDMLRLLSCLFLENHVFTQY